LLAACDASLESKVQVTPTVGSTAVHDRTHRAESGAASVGSSAGSVGKLSPARRWSKRVKEAETIARLRDAQTRIESTRKDSLRRGKRDGSTTTSTPSSSTTPSTSGTTTVPSTEPGVSYLFSDDFSAAGLNLNKWRPNWLAGNDTAITKPVNSAEISCYDPAQVSQPGDGYLHLRAVKRSCTANNGITYQYASGLVESAHDFTFTYGRMEARMWLPGSAAGGHNWPAFWADGLGKWPSTGELDVMEILSGGQPCWHFHSLDANGQHQGPGSCARMANPSGWHTFAAEWRPGVVDFFYDGVKVGRLSQWITSSPMFLILNLGISTEHGGDLVTPSETLVDYVRVTSLT
jgi:beta-glucanase (GH16 family)